jgi:hypothetical protein
MSEEIKEFAPVVNLNGPSEAPKFDPNKKYTWNNDTPIVLSGHEFGLLLNSLRSIVSTKEAQTILIAAQAADAVEAVLERNVVSGTIVEKIDPPKNSL